MTEKQSNAWGSWFDGERVFEDYMNERVLDVFSVECSEKFERDFSLTDQDKNFKGDEPRRRK